MTPRKTIRAAVRGQLKSAAKGLTTRTEPMVSGRRCRPDDGSCNGCAERGSNVIAIRLRNTETRICEACLLTALQDAGLAPRERVIRDRRWDD